MRADVRKEMLTMSGIFGVAGLFVQPVYLHDWWRPLTITGTSVGIEDFVFGATIGGISAVAYEVVYRKRLRPRKVSRKKARFDSELFFGSSLLCAALFFGLFYFASFTSFYASVAALILPTALIWWRRSDLIIDSLASGMLVVFFGLWWFWIAELFTPGWVENYWLLENLSGTILMTAPIEDLIWGFLCGLYIGPLYEFWQEQKITSKAA
ncbi:MAG TPA: lycopene cyclase domain-containing protein [Candidatus Paceibacterota bacterium]|nr:lycopene cyclase domain-containing protein [Candidatus Paceibacterota bacterium]